MKLECLYFCLYKKKICVRCFGIGVSVFRCKKKILSLKKIHKLTNHFFSYYYNILAHLLAHYISTLLLLAYQYIAHISILTLLIFSILLTNYYYSHTITHIFTLLTLLAYSYIQIFIYLIHFSFIIIIIHNCYNTVRMHFLFFQMSCIQYKIILKYCYCYYLVPSFFCTF